VSDLRLSCYSTLWFTTKNDEWTKLIHVQLKPKFNNPTTTVEKKTKNATTKLPNVSSHFNKCLLQIQKFPPLLYLKIAANKQSSQCNSYLKLENSPLKVDSFKDQIFWKKLLVGSLNYDQLFRTCTVVNPLFLNATDKKFVLKFGLQYFFFFPPPFENIIPIFPPLWKKYTKQNVIFRCQNISFFLSQRLYYSVSENTSNHIIVFPSPQIFFFKVQRQPYNWHLSFWTQ